MKHAAAVLREGPTQSRGFLPPVTVKKIKEDCRALNAND